MLKFMKKITLLILCLLFLNFDKKSKAAQNIVDQSVEFYGGKKFNNFSMTFNFREFLYTVSQNNGVFEYKRAFYDAKKKVIEDILNNDGFTRTRKGKKVKLKDYEVSPLSQQVNSVVYFVLLPHKLKDPAVNLKYLGTKIINKKTYNKIKVTFKKEGGGEDYTDAYCYWFNAKTKTLDYFAYTNGGPRFRVAKNQKKYEGLMFQDYDNYLINNEKVKVENYDVEFIKKRVTFRSSIEQTNIMVNVN
jgi:hypothetical protein